MFMYKNQVLLTISNIFVTGEYNRQTGTNRSREGGTCDSIISLPDSDNSGVTSDFSSHEVYTALLPKDCPT